MGKVAAAFVHEFGRYMRTGRAHCLMTEVSIPGDHDADAIRVHPQQSVDRTINVCAFVTLALLLYSALPWRSKQYFSDQFDAVVLAKTALMLLALAAAVWIRGYAKRHGRQPNSVPAFAFLAALVYLCISTMGSLLFGDFSATGKLSMRAAVIALVVLLLFEAVRPIVLVDLFARLLTVVTILASVTGGFSTTGRLTGVIPPMHPNEIAFLAAVPMIYYIWRTANLDFNALRIAVIIALGIIIVLSDSRTTSGAVLVAIAVVVVRGRRNPAVNLAIVATMMVALVFLSSFTDVLKSFSDRGGDSPVDTLGSRTIAWEAVLHSAPGPVQMLVGQGLATKKVGVQGQWWTSQILDSAWISAYVQAGLIGLALAGLVVVYTIIQATRTGRPNADMWIGLLILVTIRSVFESGLLDTSTSFILLMLLAIGASTDAKARRATLTTARP